MSVGCFLLKIVPVNKVPSIKKITVDKLTPYRLRLSSQRLGNKGYKHISQIKLRFKNAGYTQSTKANFVLVQTP